MDKQLLEQEAEKLYPIMEIALTSDSIQINDFRKREQQAYIAGATSSSTVKELEREVEYLKQRCKLAEYLVSPDAHELQPQYEAWRQLKRQPYNL